MKLGTGQTLLVLAPSVVQVPLPACWLLTLYMNQRNGDGCGHGMAPVRAEVASFRTVSPAGSTVTDTRIPCSRQLPSCGSSASRAGPSHEHKAGSSQMPSLPSRCEACWGQKPLERLGKAPAGLESPSSSLNSLGRCLHSQSQAVPPLPTGLWA